MNTSSIEFDRQLAELDHQLTELIVRAEAQRSAIEDFANRFEVECSQIEAELSQHRLSLGVS
jgi:hypothetical protein